MTKPDVFMRIVESFSPSLLNSHDYQEVLQREMALILDLQAVNIGNNDIVITLYSDSGQAVSNDVVVDWSKL